MDDALRGFILLLWRSAGGTINHFDRSEGAAGGGLIIAHLDDVLG